MTYLDTGHRHSSMSDMWACRYCGNRFQKGKNFFERLVKEKPEVFEYKPPEFKPDNETKEMFGKLVERVKKDKLYRRHIERLAYGTEEQKDEEIAKNNEGYYRNNYEEDGNIKEV